MTFDEWSNKKKKKKEWVSMPNEPDEEDIAPVVTTPKVSRDYSRDEDKNSGGLLSKGRLSDGYDFGDITLGAFATIGDIASQIVEGVGNVAEGVYDFGVQGVAAGADLIGEDDFADKAREHAEKDYVSDSQAEMRYALGIDDASFLGDFSRNVGQALGQVVTAIGTAPLGGWVPIALMGVSSMGSGINEAYEMGATDGGAWAYGTLKGAIDAGTELLFGGLGKGVNALGVGRGITSLDDMFAKKLSSKISNTFFSNLTEWGVKASAEGAEEFLAGAATIALKKLTVMHDEDIEKLIKDENLLEQFAIGAITSGIAQSGGLITSTTQGRDFITDLSKNEQSVVEAEYESRLADAEHKGDKLTNKQKNELYKQVEEDLKKGFISTDTIERVLGGDNYKAYQDTIAEEEAAIKELEGLLEGDELKAAVDDILKNSKRGEMQKQLSEYVQKSLTEQKGNRTLTDTYLVESYNENARRGQAFEADLSQYDEKYQATIQKAIDSKILNNTRRTHEFVDMIAKISADKGVSFDFSNNEKIANSSFAVNGKVVNAYVQDGNITLNTQSAKQLNTVVGHEIAHVLEGTEVYDVLQQLIFDYASARKSTSGKFENEYKERLYNARQLYKDVQGYEGVEGFKKIKHEVVSDLVGDYLFTDPDFVKHLSTKNRNVFEKIYDEVKYLCKVATAGSKEARQLEKVKRAFEEAYRADSKADIKTDKTYSLSIKYSDGSIEELADARVRYDDIEKGLKAIIEDHGAENIAAAKKIEFEINDRLLNGYNDGQYDIPADQEYINLLNAKQNAVQTEEANKQLSATDEHVPPVGDIAPVIDSADAETAPTETEAEIAPTKEYEAIDAEEESTEEGERKGKRRKFVKSSIESDAVDGHLLQEDLDQNKIFYQPISNKATLNDANTRLESMGYEASVAYFNSQFANKKTTVDDIVLGERLIQEAIKRGDNKTAGELIEDVAILGTELGQKVQALSIIKRLTPEGQLRLLQRTVERGKTKGDKAYADVEITQEMIDKILGVYAKTSDEDVIKLQGEIAKLDGTKLTRTDAFYVNGDTYKHRAKLKELGFKWDAEKKAWYLPDASGTFDQAELNAAVEDVKQEIAKKMKVSITEKANAWRYLSMLGNPKTHIRNLVSNVAMRGTTAVKDVVARTIETVAPIKNRTKTWKPATEEVKTFAKNTAVEMKDILQDGGKYNEEASIKAKRATFKNKVLNGVYELNNNLLSKEDWWFSKPVFTKALSEYLTANGISTTADIANNPEIVAKAKQYATEQSQIATFRQYSWLANKINEIERHDAVTGMAVGAVLPFKKTPINIAKTALNYSPLGFAKTLTYDAIQVKKGKMEASTLIDHLSQNVTGTALTLVGYMLASAGFLNGGGEDDKEGEYDYQLGEQAYSVNIGGATFSLSWLSPIAMPLFVGANAYEQLVEGKEWNGDVVIETLAQTLDPLSEMSFLSSLDSVLSSYDSGIEKFAGIGQSMAQNYITQYIPTLSSQVAATFDDTKRTTKVAGDSNFKFVDETINNLKYKIPFLRQTLEPTTDIWGNEVKQSENIVTRAFESFLAPYAKRDDISSEVDAEIKALYSETGDDGLIPSIPNNYINYKNEKYKMSAEEYTTYKATYGQTAFGLLQELFNTDTYYYASAEDRADMVNKVYDYARDTAKEEFLSKRGVGYTNASSDGEDYYNENPIYGAIRNDLTIDEYSFSEKYPEKYTVAKAVGGYDVYKSFASDLYDIKADKDSNGKSISGSRKKKVIDYINNLNADYGEKIIMFKSVYTADDTYNNAIIEYLNSREDISYSEMETILKELGFEVSADGSVSW